MHLHLGGSTWSVECFSYLATLLIPNFATAQDKAVVEIGTRLGVAIQTSGGTTFTHFGVPGQGILFLRRLSGWSSPKSL